MSLFKKKKNKNVTSREEINAELETESLKKSHSSWSNFLLTILSIDLNFPYIFLLSQLPIVKKSLIQR